ncbi:uncharacterized protein V1510DRAFT_431893 [Dipodascopsis tothii]|uniref:uncharacterized protein n=1 Tax=Dipodascopsis tothii TaxID=44089 RepID=UPI0034CEE9B0
MAETEQTVSLDASRSPSPNGRGPGGEADMSIDREQSLQSYIYDTVIWALAVVFDLFFREIRPRGAFRIPRHGPVIFVAAPHANQFIDPIMLMRQIRVEAGRRLSFLVAEASMHRKFVGTVARSVMSIPVSRAQDLSKPGAGVVYMLPEDDETVLRGEGTKFTTEMSVNGQVQLSQLGAAEVGEIVSDTELKLKLPFRNAGAVPKLREEKLKYKFAPKVDQSEVYDKVFSRLHQGGCIGIFPEGGSHDRTTLLPLKAGAAIMALGAINADPSCDVKIVPCGMNYFHPHKFRSRAVIEFGSPLSVPAHLVELYKTGQRREATAQLLDLIYDSLLTVTVTAPDYDTLMVIQAARRLYKPAHKKIPLSLVVDMNRRLIIGYTHYKDDPRIIHLREAVANYNKQLQQLGIRDHQVEYASVSTWRALGKLVFRTGKLLVLSVGALPGVVLFAPVFVATKLISRKKAAEALRASTVKIAARDVVATWKVLVSLGLAPTLYWFYALLATWAAWRYDLVPSFRPVWLVTLVSWIIFPMITFAALRIGEVGMDIAKSLRPLVKCLNPHHSDTLTRLRATRESLSKEVTEVINSLGPEVFPEFETHRVLFGNGTVKPESSDRLQSTSPIFSDYDEDEDKKHV